MNISQNKRTLMMSGAVMGLLGALLALWEIQRIWQFVSPVLSGTLPEP